MRSDPHSYASDVQPRTTSFDLRAVVDFDARVLRARVTLHFASAAPAGLLDLDTRGLSIEAVTDEAGRAVDFTLHPAEPVLGRRLELELRAGMKSVTLAYRTAPDASALQWLTPEQTLGKRQSYLFSQCQALHARSVLPCQDTPAFRVSYRAQLEVPRGLRAVMAAAPRGREERGATAIDSFEMPQPIPLYLFAFAVGDLVSKDLSPRSRVYAEPGQVDAAAWEFSGVEAMISTAEQLFGPYDWERFDLLVMPPSFPYGGMENPRLTFLTPALLAGDKSLVNVVAHELAHSWTGNLVTNANAEHFWLNEGFTVFAERRILEALEGKELAALHAALGFQALQEALARFKDQPELTCLRTHLSGVDPDETFSQVPYEKGYLFLKVLEAAAGRGAFDAALQKWLQAHRFGVGTTEGFLALVGQELPGVLERVNAREWIDAPGLPANAPRPSSARLEAVRQAVGRVPSVAETMAWSPTEWQLYLDTTARPVPLDQCQQLEARFSLTQAKNPDVLVAWLTLACESGFAAVLPKVEEVVGRFGRLKYLRPLYQAMHLRQETRATARALFQRLKPSYHPIAQHVIGGLLAKEP